MPRCLVGSFLLAWGLMLAGCAGLVDTVEELVVAAQGIDDQSSRPSPVLVTEVLEQGSDIALDTAWQTYVRALRIYARGRVVEMAPEEREPMRFSGWTAPDDLLATEADASGLLTRWDDDYYVTHTWSTYGQSILSMIPGDSVELNGRLLHVQGIFDYPKDAYLDEVRFLLDPDAVVMQTCEPNSDLNRIVYGGWDES